MSSNRARGGWGPQIILAAVMTVFCVGMLEVGLRLIARTDEDGSVYLRQRQIVFAPPVHRVEAAVRAYRSSSSALFMDDPTLGWKPRPGAHNDLYAYDAEGRRAASPDAPVTTPRARLRVAVFGDSFAHGSEVPFADSWAHQLEVKLAASAAPAGDAPAVEVLNFGVPGYGMDQAFLRWEQDGRAAKPDVVIFALQVENAHRDVNLLRPLYDAADLPFAKPRFVESQGKLDLINVPVPKPEEVVKILGRMDQWPLVRYERYYRGPERPIWQHSLLASLVHDVVAEKPADQTRDLTPEEHSVALGIVRQFARSVEAAGARFVMVHIATRAGLEYRRDAGVVPNSIFIAEASASAPVVRPERALIEAAGRRPLASLFRPGGHYTAAGNAAVATAVADYLRGELDGSGSIAAEAAGHTQAN